MLNDEYIKNLYSQFMKSRGYNCLSELKYLNDEFDAWLEGYIKNIYVYRSLMEQMDTGFDLLGAIEVDKGALDTAVTPVDSTTIATPYIHTFENRNEYQRILEGYYFNTGRNSYLTSDNPAMTTGICKYNTSLDEFDKIFVHNPYNLKTLKFLRESLKQNKDVCFAVSGSKYDSDMNEKIKLVEDFKNQSIVDGFVDEDYKFDILQESDNYCAAFSSNFYEVNKIKIKLITL